MSIFDEGWVPGELDRRIKRNREEGWKNLSSIQRAFAFAYVETLSHVEAARQINKPGHGLRFLRDPYVADFISALQGEAYKTNLLVNELVQQKWMEILPKLAGEEPVYRTLGNGAEVHTRHFDSAALTKALTEIGKSTKFYAEGSGGEESIAQALRDVLVSRGASE